MDLNELIGKTITEARMDYADLVLEFSDETILRIEPGATATDDYELEIEWDYEEYERRKGLRL